VTRWFNSPTDTFLSPCTQKLMVPKTDGSNTIAPLRLEDCLDDEEEEQVGMEVDESADSSGHSTDTQK